jgi:vitamin B12 transporter
MKTTTIASLLGLAFSTQAFAAITLNSDDVVVTASRIPQPKESVIADVTVINQEEIERAGQSTFIELLQRQPGIEISSNGGAGTISSIFMRGTNSNQIVTLIDGVRLNSLTDGATYFGNIPLSQIERIEILRGPASSLYGQDAVGGVIQIFTKKIEGQPRFNAAVGYGSYNTKSAEAGFGGSYNGLNYSVNVSSKDMDGFSSLKTKSTANSDKDSYRNLSTSGSVSYDINDKNQIGLQFLESNGSVHFDNRFDSAFFDTYAKLKQSSISIFSKNQMTDAWKSILRLSQGTDKNDSYMSYGVDEYKSTQKQYSWQNDFTLPIGTLTGLIDRLEQDITSNTNYTDTKRNSNGLYLGYLANLDAHSLQVNLRRDDSSQYGTHVARGIGYGYQLSSQWRATASYGTAFKAPSFNDIYYPYGMNNPNLKPEESENFEAAVKYNDKYQALSATVYHNRVRDFIALDSSYIPQNYNAILKGITIAGKQSWNDFMLRGNIDIQSPRNDDNQQMLIRRANRHGAFSLSRNWNEWLFDLEVIGSSVRYNDVENTQKLAGYAILNLTANYKINNDWSVQGRANNILDKDYVLAIDGTIPYNTPGANVFFSLRYSPSY